MTAADGSTQDYTVTVTVALDPAKEITDFTFGGPDPAFGMIDPSAHTIAVTVPGGTDVSDLVASFTTTGASVAVGDVAQVSGTTVNDFSDPVTYTVTAADGSTQDYTVTVTAVWVRPEVDEISVERSIHRGWGGRCLRPRLHRRHRGALRYAGGHGLLRDG